MPDARQPIRLRQCRPGRINRIDKGLIWFRSTDNVLRGAGGRRRNGWATSEAKGGTHDTVSGEALIDLIPDPEKAAAYDAVLGGSPYNVAIGLGRLGSQTAFVSRISTDGNGDALAAALATMASICPLSRATIARRRSLSSCAAPRKTGSRYSFYLDGTSFDGPWPFPEKWPAAASHLHVGSISAVDPRHGERVVAALTGGVRSCDGQLRPEHPPACDAGSRNGRGARRAAGVACACREGERRGPSMALSRPLRRGEPCRIGVDADHASASPRSASAARSPCWARNGSRFRAPRVEVVDTVGAGDSFMSALLSAMDRDSALGGGSAAPDRASLERWLTFAACASAITCTRKGSNPPTRAEVELRSIAEPEAQ